MSRSSPRSDAYLLELAGGVAILLAGNLLFLPDDPGFLSARPHPALFLIAVMAARYGLREGVMSGVVAAGLVLAWTIIRTDTLVARALLRLDLWLTPLLLVGTGFVLGALGEQRRRESARLAERAAALEQELADQAVRFMASAEAKHELERRVVEESGSLSQLYTTARAMETLEPARLYPAIVTTVRRFIEADACQLYVMEGGTLHLRAAEGPAPPRAEIALDEGLAGLAIQRGKPTSIRDLTLVASLDDLQNAAMLMAAPLQNDAGVLLGCITVTRLPFFRLTPTSLDRLGVVADWAARALTNARAHEQALASTITDDLVSAYTYAYYQRRLEEEQGRADRYGRPLTVAIFKVAALELVRPERRVELGRLLSLVFSRTARATDLICRYATEDAFAIVLPETPLSEAQAFAERLSTELRNFKFRPYADEERELDFTLRVLSLREPAPRPVA